MVPRNDKQAPNVYFGRPGALVTLPWPLGDINKSYERLTYDFVSGGGQHTVSSLPSGSRSQTVTWNALHIDAYNRLAQYWLGAMGTGPWAFIDPSVPNMLLPNQASASNALYDTTGWATATGLSDMGTLFSSTSQIHRPGAQRSIRWQFPVTVNAFPTLNLIAPYRNWYGIPAVPGLPYTFSAWARPDSVIDTAITMAAKMLFLDAAGVLIGSSVSSGDINMNSGYVRLVATGTAPAGTAYVQSVFVATGSTITVGASIYIDEVNLEQDSVANDWAPGTGLRPVEILGLDDKVPVFTRMRTGANLTLRELMA